MKLSLLLVLVLVTIGCGKPKTSRDADNPALSEGHEIPTPKLETQSITRYRLICPKGYVMVEAFGKNVVVITSADGYSSWENENPLTSDTAKYSTWTCQAQPTAGEK